MFYWQLDWLNSYHMLSVLANFTRFALLIAWSLVRDRLLCRLASKRVWHFRIILVGHARHIYLKHLGTFELEIIRPYF